MREKILTNRKRKPSRGRVIRVSDPVFFMLQRKLRARESWDSLLRRLFGMPRRDGTKQPLIEGWLEVHTGRFFLDEAEARGASVVASARAKTKKFSQPLRMRELA